MTPLDGLLYARVATDFEPSTVEREYSRRVSADTQKHACCFWSECRRVRATPFLVIPIARDLALFLFFLLLFVYPPSLSYGTEFLVPLQTKLTNVRKGGIVESEEKLL